MLVICVLFALAFAESLFQDEDLVALITKKSNLYKAATSNSRSLESWEPVQINLTMTDGVLLWTKYWSLDESSQKTTVYLRSPYGPDKTENLAYLWIPFNFAIVMQNDRGTGLSGGDFDINASNAQDGRDSMDWIVAQPWSNGVVYEFGASADGMYSYLSLRIPQPHLYGAWYMWSNSLLYFTMYQDGGAFRNHLVTNWLHHMQEWRPKANSYLYEVVSHEGLSSYWSNVMLTNLSNVDFPALHTAGWYDIFLGPMLKTFENYQFKSQPGARGQQKLIVGPRGHCFATKDTNAYGWFKNDEFAIIWSFEESVQIFSQNFASFPPSERAAMSRNMAQLDTYTLYIMGASSFWDQFDGDGNYWTTLPSWPLATPRKLFLNGQFGLQTTPMSSSRKYAFSFDPRNPTPTIGGNNLFGSCGPLDQTPIESRRDNLIFNSDPFTEPTAIVGNITFNFYVSSNCTDTDFVVRFTDVYPTGNVSILLGDQMLRMRWRDSWSTPNWMVPNRVYFVSFESWPTSFIFSKGHILRIAITSSNYPRFGLNNNNGLLINQLGPANVARNTIYVGGSTPSFITLPVVPLSQIPANAGPF